MEMADRSRSGVQVTPARRPLDDIVNQCKTLNEVTCLMQPMPAAASKEVQSVKLGSYRETVFKGFRKRGKRQRQEQNCSDVGRLGGLQVSYKLGPANMLWIQPWDLSRNSQRWQVLQRISHLCSSQVWQAPRSQVMSSVEIASCHVLTIFRS